MGKRGARLDALWALPIWCAWLACSSTTEGTAPSPCQDLESNGCPSNTCSCPSDNECVREGAVGRCAKPCKADAECGSNRLCSWGHCVAVCGVGTAKNDCEGNPYNGSHSYPCNSNICNPEDNSDCKGTNVARDGVVYYKCSYSNPPSSTSSSSSSSSSGSTCNYSKCVEACSQAGGTNCGQDCKCP